MIPVPGPWADEAACASDPDAMYPDKVPSASARLAVAICGRCPVRRECLTYAMAVERTTAAHGVWGGMTADQRRKAQARAS